MKKKKELLRVQQVIENDRIGREDNFIELVKSDEEKLLKDYFEFDSLPDVSIEKENDTLRVKIEFVATRIKNFIAIPK